MKNDEQDRGSIDDATPEEWDRASAAARAETFLVRRDISTLKPGEIIHTTNWGLTEFRRWDSYRGQRTAEIRSIDYGGTYNPFPEQLQEAHDAWLAARFREHVVPAPSASPAALTDEQREKVCEAVADALGDAYDCMRVWSAWGAGTMGSDDFALVAEDDSRVAEIADAAIAATLATSSVAAAPAAPQPSAKEP